MDILRPSSHAPRWQPCAQGILQFLLGRQGRLAALSHRSFNETDRITQQMLQLHSSSQGPDADRQSITRLHLSPSPPSQVCHLQARPAGHGCSCRVDMLLPACRQAHAEGLRQAGGSLSTPADGRMVEECIVQGRKALQPLRTRLAR